MRFGKVDRFLLFGGGELLRRVADDLHGSAVDVSVVTSPRHAAEEWAVDDATNSLTGHLESIGVDCLTTSDASRDQDVAALITDATIGISFGAAWLFTAEFLDRFDGRLVNCHGTLLPLDRGGASLSWRILRGDRRGASVLHRVDAGVDTGGILLMREFVYPRSCRVPAEYRDYGVEQDMSMMRDFVRRVLSDDRFDTLAQPNYLSTYWPRLATDIHGYIDWNWTASEIERFTRAFDAPYPGAATFVGSTKVRLRSCWTTNADSPFHPFQAGLIYRRRDDGLYVACRDGVLVVGHLVEADEHVEAPVRLGDRFHTPAEHLDRARRVRVIYDAEGIRNDG